MRRLIVRVAGLLLVAALAVLGISGATGVAFAGENQATKWHNDGFACIFNNDGTTTCRFEVDVKNKLKRVDWFRCKVRVNFTNKTWKGKTTYKRIGAGEWKALDAIAEKVEEGEIVKRIKWSCWEGDR